MSDIFNILKTLCELDGPSGNEDRVRNFIINEIKDFCDAEIDPMGNIIAFKKGKNSPKYKVMLDAHMDEVGVIITDITSDGFLKFQTVGGIKTESLFCKNIRFGETLGVIGAKPIHQSSPDERKVLPSVDALYIDIGAEDKETAEKAVSIGDIGTFATDWQDLTKDIFLAKAIDDRVGCAVLINILKQPAEYDFYATFTVGEEIGCRGAKTATYTVSPDFAIALECTTAFDLHKNSDNPIAKVGQGVAVSFMDRSTLYDRDLYNFTLNLANEKGIAVQVKTAVTGGNNSGAIHLTKSGVRTITLSLPGRYIHSSATVGSRADVLSQNNLATVLLNELAGGALN